MGIKTIAIEQIPSKLFIPVEMKRDILKARILMPSEKKELPKGSPDVKVVSPLGHKGMMTRNEILKGYVYINGRRIKMAGWKSGSEYLIMRNKVEPAVAMMVPSKVAINVNGKAVKPSRGNNRKYIVCNVGESGEIELDTASIISSALFRKIFSVPPNELIDKYRGRGKSKVGVSGVRDKSKVMKKQINKTKEELGIGNASGGINIGNGIGNIDNIDINKAIKPKNVGESTSKKVTAVGRIVNNEDKIIGFIVKDSKGMKRQVTKKEMTVLCSRKLVDNIVLATKENTGTKYLRGNGIKISDLAKHSLMDL